MTFQHESSVLGEKTQEIKTFREKLEKNQDKPNHSSNDSAPKIDAGLWIIELHLKRSSCSSTRKPFKDVRSKNRGFRAQYGQCA